MLRSFKGSYFIRRLSVRISNRFLSNGATDESLGFGAQEIKVESYNSHPFHNEEDKDNGGSIKDVKEPLQFNINEMKAINAKPQGIYKAILLGEVGYDPSQKTMRNGLTVTLFSLGTSGMRNNRKPFENETPEQYAKRSYVQWHRIAVYQYKLGSQVMKLIKKGSHVYVEGNMETRVFFDPESGTVKRIQEVAVRQNGKIIFLDKTATDTGSKPR